MGARATKFWKDYPNQTDYRLLFFLKSLGLVSQKAIIILLLEAFFITWIIKK